jgi:hypothetical protein
MMRGNDSDMDSVIFLNPASEPNKLSRRSKALLVVVLAAQAMATVDLAIVNVAAPTILT